MTKPAKGWYNAKTPYRSILSFVKQKGIRVYHREIKGGAGGFFDYNKLIITVHKDYRDTWAGCSILAHEITHYHDWREGKFYNFFHSHLPYTEENLKLVIDAEMSAIKGAERLLKDWGIKYDAPEFTKEGLEKSICFWKKYYFNKI
jgi:hypothetical protein